MCDISPVGWLEMAAMGLVWPHSTMLNLLWTEPCITMNVLASAFIMWILSNTIMSPTSSTMLAVVPT